MFVVLEIKNMPKKKKEVKRRVAKKKQQKEAKTPQATIPNRPNNPKELPALREKKHFIITIKDTNSIYYFGTLKQTDDYQFELRKKYNKPAWIRYADADEIEQKRPLRNLRKGEALFIPRKNQFSFRNWAKDRPGVTTELLDKIEASAEKRMQLNRKIQAACIKKRDEYFQSANPHRKK